MDDRDHDVFWKAALSVRRKMVSIEPTTWSLHSSCWWMNKWTSERTSEWINWCWQRNRANSLQSPGQFAVLHSTPARRVTTMLMVEAAFQPPVTGVVRIVYWTNLVALLVPVVAAAVAADAVDDVVVSDTPVVEWTAAPTMTTVAVARFDVVVVVSNIGVGSLIVVPSLLAQFSMPTDVNVVLASLLQFAVVPVRSWRLDWPFPVDPWHWSSWSWNDYVRTRYYKIWPASSRPGHFVPRMNRNRRSVSWSTDNMWYWGWTRAGYVSRPLNTVMVTLVVLVVVVVVAIVFASLFQLLPPISRNYKTDTHSAVFLHSSWLVCCSCLDCPVSDRVAIANSIRYKCSLDSTWWYSSADT